MTQSQVPCAGASAAAAAAASNGTLATSEGAGAAEEEIVAERLLRELTAEHFTLLIALQDEGAPVLLACMPGGTSSACRELS